MEETKEMKEKKPIKKVYKIGVCGCIAIAVICKSLVKILNNKNR